MKTNPLIKKQKFLSPTFDHEALKVLQIFTPSSVSGYGRVEPLQSWYHQHLGTSKILQLAKIVRIHGEKEDERSPYPYNETPPLLWSQILSVCLQNPYIHHGFWSLFVGGWDYCMDYSHYIPGHVYSYLILFMFHYVPM